LLKYHTVTNKVEKCNYLKENGLMASL
jgi:hypothetical protein